MKFNSDELRKDIITKRVIDLNITMDEAAKQIGISKATLSRLENGKMPDIKSFYLIVNWLELGFTKYFIS